jgi:transcriptional regulator GlxA family with amidase domain
MDRTVTQVALLALEDCYITSLGGMSAVMLLANKLNRAQDAFAWQVLSLNGGAVRAGTHINILSDACIGAEQFDVVCVPTLYYTDKDAFLRMLEQSRPLYPWLRQQWEGGAVIAASGTGTFLVAEAGLLDGRKATTVHWLTERFQCRYPKVRLQDQALITEDERLLCSAAPTSYLRMAQRLVSLFMGAEIASQCAKAILLDAGLSGESTHMPQYIDPALHDALAAQTDHWFDRHMAEGAGVDELAQALAMSVRTLNRHFQKELGTTPAAYLQQRRLEAARQLLESTELSLFDIARRVGYSDNSSFSRVFHRQLGVTPASYRNQYRLSFS